MGLDRADAYLIPFSELLARLFVLVDLSHVDQVSGSGSTWTLQRCVDIAPSHRGGRSKHLDSNLLGSRTMRNQFPVVAPERHGYMATFYR